MFNKKYEELSDRVIELENDNHLSISECRELLAAITLKDRDDKLVSDGTLNEGSGCSCNNGAPMMPNGPINLPIKGFTPEGDPILDKNQMQILGGPGAPMGNNPLMPPCDVSNSPVPPGMNPFTNS